jgi:Family of unknown function (DUF6065)
MSSAEMDSPNSRLIAYRVAHTTFILPFPAPISREWMNATAQRFAHRCLPLLLANQAGWFIPNAQTIHATWTGQDDPRSLRVEYEDADGPRVATSHFGHGILTWNLPYLFRTPEGMNLLARGPANCPKDGAAPLEGIVEADWAVATFTMNWKITRPNHRVTFEAGEPICMLVPHQRGELERLHPVVVDIHSEPETAHQYVTWQESRARFLWQLNVPHSSAAHRGWQRDYFRGQAPTGLRASEHQLRVRLRGFQQEKKIPNKEREAVAAQRHPQVDMYVRKISTKTKYPIKNFGQLIQALGGDDAPIEFEHWREPAGRLKAFIPEHYFPVVSEEDLVNKAETLLAQYKGVSQPEADVAAQPEEEMPAELRADFAKFPRRNLDLARVARLTESESPGGVARLPDD